jgi:predicted extracellular nuclease
LGIYNTILNYARRDAQLCVSTIDARPRTDALPYVCTIDARQCVFTLVFFGLFIAAGCAPGIVSQKTVVFYNVENLFDTYDDPVTNDNEFLPESKKEWTQERYLRKLQDLAAVLSETGDRHLPAIIGLCEVENLKVVEDLAVTGRLKHGRYSAVHYDSPDARGIDVALLYQPSEFSVKGSTPIAVKLPGKSRLSTRDILHVWGRTTNDELLHIFVNHWPSKAGGVEQTRSGRMAAARVLRSKTDSLFRLDAKTKIIIMGDFNDNPDDVKTYGNVETYGSTSLLKTYGSTSLLKAVHPDSLTHPSLVNLMYPAHLRGEGTYNYRGSWDMIDHIIVSSSLLSGRGIRVENAAGHVFNPDWITFTNSRGQKVPNRTYVGNRYEGGISDHFPVWIRLVY